MDIVSRIKEFINYRKIPVTQFADTCHIPRPTLSQLLNGRNKKVSDELIGKIHEAFPELSVMWLLFNEGEMLTAQNIETSGPQKMHEFEYVQPDIPVNEPNSLNIDFNPGFPENSSDNFTEAKNVQSAANTSSINFSEDLKNESAEEIPSTITFNPNQSKKIVNIIVYYNDNSFESFIPGSKG